MLFSAGFSKTVEKVERNLDIGSPTGYSISGVVIAVGEGVSLTIPTIADASYLLAYGLVSHCMGLLFIASSLPKVTTTEAGLALLLQPTLSFLWDVVFFARPMTAAELTGAAIALLAIYLGSRPASKKV